MRRVPKFLRPHRNTLRTWLVLVGLLTMRFSSPWFTFGCLLVVVGSLFRLWAKGHLTQRMGLATDGAYQICRNPFYLGNLLVDAGVCAMGGRLVVALPYLGLWFAFHIHKIRREEADLLVAFGDEYRAYVASVPRLVPRVWLLIHPAGSRRRFSWLNRNLAKRIEIPRFLSSISLPPLFYAWPAVIRDGWGFFRLQETGPFFVFCVFLWLQLLSRSLRAPLRNGCHAIAGWVYSAAGRCTVLAIGALAAIVADERHEAWFAAAVLIAYTIVVGRIAAAQLHERYDALVDANPPIGPADDLGCVPDRPSE